MDLTLFIGGLRAGGAERVICGLANYLSAENTVRLLTLSDTKPEYQINPEVKILNVDHPGHGRLFKNAERIASLIRYVGKNRETTYIAFLPIPSFLILGLRPFIRGNIIFSIRNDPSSEYGGKLSRLLCRILFPLADGVVFQTPEAEQYFRGIRLKSSTVIANPISREFLEEGGQGAIEKKKRIVSVGRLDPQKNFALLIQSFAEIAARYSDYDLVIYGEGPEREKLERQIREKGLAGRCHLPGKTDRIREKLEEAELFVSSSDYEGISNALLEAMAVGLPVITTDWAGGGAQVLVENGKNGVIVPTRNPGALSLAMDQLLKDEGERLRLSRNASLTREKFSPEVIFKKWESYMIELRSDNRSVVQTQEPR